MLRAIQLGLFVSILVAGCFVPLAVSQTLDPASPGPAPADSAWPVPPSAAPPAVAAPAAAPAPAPAPAASQGSLQPGGKGMAALIRASSLGRYFFAFFHAGQNEQTDAMWAVFQSAMTKTGGRAESAAVLVSDPLEQEIVHRFAGVDRAPMPLVLVIAPNGAIMGGFPTKFEEAQLLGAFGTPAMEQSLKALQERRLVFVCIQNQSTQQNDAAMYGVQEMKNDPQFGAAVVTVFVNPADPNEARFLTQLQIDTAQNVAQTVILVPPGSAVGKFMGGTTKTMLTSKLQSSGACGPGGACAGGKCGPGGCAPPGGAAAAPPPQEPSGMKRFFSKVAGAMGR